MKTIDFYEKCVSDGELPCHGLCVSLMSGDETELLELFKPKWKNVASYYWGFKGTRNLASKNRHAVMYGLTPFRQNIILLIAAMRNEL